MPKPLGFLAALALLALAGCGGDADRPAPAGGAGGKPVVVATVLPVYALALEVAGEAPGVELVLLLPASGGCPHDYALSPGDVAKLARAKVLLANGAGFEAFLTKDALAAANKTVKVVELSEGLELIPRAPDGDDRDKDAKKSEEHHHHEGAWNPHTFASPRCAAKMTLRIGEALAEADPAGAEGYRRNAAESAKRLETLADEFAAAGKTFPNRKIVAMHDVFFYLARDAGLSIVGVVEEEPGQEPGPGVFIKLVAKVKAERPAAILGEPQYSDKPARALSRETGVPVVLVDPFATGKAARGEYERTMRANLEVLKKALGPGPRP